MLEFRHILIPVDFREPPDSLADLALTMSRKLGATRTTFLHVLPHLPDLSDYLPDSLSRLESEFRRETEAKMDAFLAPIRDAADNIEGVVVDGETAGAILSYAGEQNVDLIIIASHGIQGIEKMVLGSVADRVIKGASCPTLVWNPFKALRGYEVCRPLSACIETV